MEYKGSGLRLGRRLETKIGTHCKLSLDSRYVGGLVTHTILCLFAVCYCVGAFVGA